MSAILCPDCAAGKHDNCTGDSWDFDADEPAPCPCTDESHLPTEEDVEPR